MDKKYLPYESAVLNALQDTTGLVMLSEIYRRVKIYKTEEAKTLFPMREENDPEYQIRWALWNMGERGLVKNSAHGLWEIMDAGRAYLIRSPDDLDDM
jgi:restriction endonuclease Mrr